MENLVAHNVGYTCSTVDQSQKFKHPYYYTIKGSTEMNSDDDSVSCHEFVFRQSKMDNKCQSLNVTKVLRLRAYTALKKISRKKTVKFLITVSVAVRSFKSAAMA